MSDNQNQPAPPIKPAYYGSERQFRRYEQYVKTIVEAWPKLSIFTPQPPVNSVETLSTRIRVAIQSLRNNQWTTTLVPMAKFMQMCDEVVVSTNANPGKVTCGPSESIRTSTPLGMKAEVKDAQGTSNIEGLVLTEPPRDVIEALIILHHHQILVEPTTLKVDRSLPELYEMAGNRDVSFVQDETDPTKFTLL